MEIKIDVSNELLAKILRAQAMCPKVLAVKKIQNIPENEGILKEIEAEIVCALTNFLKHELVEGINEAGFETEAPIIAAIQD